MIDGRATLSRIYFVLLAATLLLAPSVQANDSSSAIGIGGLELTKNDAISMDSEDLYLSQDKVLVKYRFTNTTDKDVETLVTFPLPAIPTEIQGYLGDQSYPDWSDFGFKTTVEGKPVTFETTQVVEANGHNVAARLKELGWPVQYWTSEAEDFFDSLQKLPLDQKKAYIAEGLLKMRDGEGNYVDPTWQVATRITRKQIFPAGKTVSVEHSYDPQAGGSVGGMLEKDSRKEAYFKEYADAYCVDKPFLKSFDRIRYAVRKDKDGEDISGFYVETWLNYILKSGANWKGPIKNFRLVVDKGSANNLVSLCMPGIRKISPTQFEVVKKDFEPTTDIEILIVRFAPLD